VTKITLQKQASELRVLRRHVLLLRKEMDALQSDVEAHRAFVETREGCTECEAHHYAHALGEVRPA